MRLNCYLSAALFLNAMNLGSSVAMAKPLGKPTPKAAVVDEEEVEAPTRAPSNSASARQQQKANVDLLYTPLSDFVLSAGLGASYNINSDLAVGGTYLTGNKSISSSETSGGVTTKSDAKLSGLAIYGNARYFVSNSFNVTAGLGLRSATLKYSVDDTAGNSVSGKIDINSIVLPIFIGNRWTWKSGFTLGCDWVGVLVPISGSAKNTISGNLSSSSMQSLNQSIVDLGDKLAKTSSLTLLLTSVGWAF